MTSKVDHSQPHQSSSSPIYHSTKAHRKIYSSCILGAQLGDEGKGRFVDNTVQSLLQNKSIQKIYVIRFQGGSNAGHTVYTKEGQKVPLHQLPSSVLEKRAVGIMDTGMIIHLEDLKTEIEDVEKIVGSIKDNIVLSQDALLCTDLERAEEVLNRFKSSGKSEGGTGRGISPTYANHYSRLGLTVKDLFKQDWKEILTARYERYEKEFHAFDFELSQVLVPDLRKTRDLKKATTKMVGTLPEFLDRLSNVRDWFLKNFPEIVQNTFLLHQRLVQDDSIGVIFEGAQAIGLHPWLGRIPDVTASDTSAYGIISGTKFWRPQDISAIIGVFKITYMSSVGSVKMVTMIDLPRQEVDPDSITSEDGKYGLWVREKAQERGTTTGRYRDICFLDLPQLSYNIQMGGITQLAGTHLDIAKQNQNIKICTHYVNEKGEQTPYQPGVEYQKGVTPIYTELEGWDGEAVEKAKKYSDLPESAKQYLQYIEEQLEVPIVAVTTGPRRDDLLEIPHVS